MQCLHSNGRGRGHTKHPFAAHEAALHTLFRSKPPCSFDAPAFQSLHQAALDSATGICGRIGLQPYQKRAMLAVHLWHRQLQGNIPKSFDAGRPLFPYAYRALTYIIYGMARESGSGCDRQMKSSPLTSEPPARTHDPAYLAQLSELPELVARLPESIRTIIALRYFDDRSTAEIAEILDISRNAVRLRSHRAVQHLRRIFGLS